MSAKKSVKNYFKNKKILFNDNSIKDIKQKQTKEKNIKNDFNNKRINKRKVLFKKLNLNYVQIKWNDFMNYEFIIKNNFDKKHSNYNKCFKYY